MRKLALTLLPLSSIASTLTFAGELPSTPDKSGYHLFNPTPEAQMREFITDRPDRTESPISVDAGHFQIETDIVALSQEGSARTWNFNLMNVKAGLTSSSDLQFVFETYGKDGDVGGVGDTTIRYKYNLFGNDGGSLAMAIMPYVTLPTQASSRGETRSEGGIIIPIGVEAPHDTGLGMMFQVDKIRNADDSGFHTQFISSITASHDVGLGLEGYVEFFSQTEAGAPWVATVDAGLVLPVGKQVRFDLGANVGVTDAADDINPFFGVSLRF